MVNPERDGAFDSVEFPDLFCVTFSAVNPAVICNDVISLVRPTDSERFFVIISCSFKLAKCEIMINLTFLKSETFIRNRIIACFGNSNACLIKVYRNASEMDSCTGQPRIVICRVKQIVSLSILNPYLKCHRYPVNDFSCYTSTKLIAASVRIRIRLSYCRFLYITLFY